MTTDVTPSASAEADDTMNDAEKSAEEHFAEMFGGEQAAPVEDAAETETQEAREASEAEKQLEPEGAEVAGGEPGDNAPDGESDDDGEDDIWASVDPKLREAFEAERKAREAAEHRYKSDEGRFHAAQRKLQELGKPDSEAAKAAQRERDKSFDKVREEYPEIAGPVADMLKAKDEQIAALSARFESFENERIERNGTQLRATHADFDNVMSKHEAVFLDWIRDQPEKDRLAFEANTSAITDPESAIELTTSFKKHLGTLGLYETPEKAKPNKRRERQLSASKAPSTPSSGPAPSGIPKDGDPEALFNAMWKDK